MKEIEKFVLQLTIHIIAWPAACTTLWGQLVMIHRFLGEKSYCLSWATGGIDISPCYSVSLLLLFLFLWDLCIPFIAFRPRNCQICAISGIKVFCHYVFSSGYFEVKTFTVRSVKVYFLSVILTTACRWLIFIYFLCDVIVAKGNERTTIILVHFLIRDCELCFVFSHESLCNLVSTLTV